MAKVQNLFINGRMDSDTDYSVVDNKSYVRAENMRIAGEGNDGAFKNLKGSKLVSSEFTVDGMQVVGIGEGNDNNLFYFLAHKNGLSKIVKYNTETKVSELIIQDNTVLRFDLVRWNNGVEIFPYKYILNIDQIGDMLHFSNENWKYPRVINLKRISDYANGFTEKDISLIKEPPLLAPIVTSKTASSGIEFSEKQNKFISFTYRYKYSDGSFSPLSFYTDSVFEPKPEFNVDEQRLNTGMVNKFDTINLSVKSGNKNITDIEVYAREHGSNTAYLIYSVNKQKSNILDNSDINNIEYKYSNNYTVLDENNTKLLYSNVPNYPKSQTAVGNRLVYFNYKEGQDLIDKNNNPININYEIEKSSNTYSVGIKNKTIISLIKNKIGILYLDDYNISSTVLLPTNQSKTEFEFDYSDRDKVNSVSIKVLNNPPKWATKFKFVVNTEPLNYEIAYITYAKKAGGNLYLYLNGDNINRLKKDDYIIRVDSESTLYKEYKVEDVAEYDIEDGLNIKGTYAKLKDDVSINLEKNGLDIRKKFYRNWRVFDAVYNTANPERFDATSGYSGTYDSYYYDSKFNSATYLKSDFGAIKEGDNISISINLLYGRDKHGRGESAIDIYGSINLTEKIYASIDYVDIGEFIKSNLKNPYIFVDVVGNEVILKTNNLFPDYVKEQVPRMYDWTPNGSGRDERAVVKVASELNVNRGVKPIIFRTVNKENLNEFYYEIPKTYLISNGNYLADRYDGSGNPIFDIEYYNGFCWGNGVESYKIKDGFNQKTLNNNFRGSLYEPNGYKQIHRKNDLTYSGLYNYELGINELGIFNHTLANWKTLSSHFGEGQRVIATNGDLSVYFTDATGIVNYGKSVIMDLTGSESVGLSNDVLGDFLEVSTFGVSENPESVVKTPIGNYFVDKKRRRILLHSGRDVQELNPVQSGFHKEGVELLKTYKSFLGAYDESHGEYVIGLDNKKSVAFNLGQKGFVSYFTNSFDYIKGANGNLYTAYKGELYQNEVTKKMNDLVGQGLFSSSVKFVVNPQMDSDKIFKAIELQSNKPFDTYIKTNYTESFIPAKNYELKESFYSSAILRNTKGNRKSYGVGKVESIVGNVLKFSYPISNSISCGDSLMIKDKSLEYEIININGKELTVSSVSHIAIGDICYGIKKYDGMFRPDGDPIRGKWMEVTLKSNTNEEIILNSVTTEVVESKL